ncbi:MAG TPA: hypothetical protein VN258_09715 [Mobilitalea sp.]|nr:hypothetical protein [Mobilitalea sp.]
MQELKYKISYNESINRWWITDVGREPFAAPYETFQAEVNLGEAYVQIVYPVRREFLKENRIDKVTYYTGEYTKVYFPFENNRIDFTTFIHTPHYLHVNAKTQLYAAEDGNYPFELYTCGGMKVWVNEKEVVCFHPYTRNIPDVLRIELPLKKGYNDIAVYADELAERDVFFYYEMRYKGDMELTGVIPLDSDVNRVNQVEEFLKSCYLPKDLITEGMLTIKMNPKMLTEPLTMTVQGEGHFYRKEKDSMFQAVINQDTTEISIGEAEHFNVGVFRLSLICDVGEFAIRRELVVGNMPKIITNIKPAKTLKERKGQGLDFVCHYGEKLVNRTMAILERQHRMTELAYECLDICIKKIEAKEDCADFYLPQLLLLITKYRNYLTDHDYERIKHSILNFRFWIDEPGNDVMWYFSENHALLFHIGQYLSGALFSEEEFTVSGRIGEEQYLIGKERIEHWFRTFEQYGYAEWNSATYIPVDLIGFFILYEMAPDEEIKAMVKKALDFTFRIISYNSFAGIMCSSYGRAYEETLKVRQLVEPNFISWISYGEGYLTSESRAASLYCLTDYTPPSCQEDVVIQEKEWMSLELDQGINQVKTYAFRTKDYFLACVRRFKPFVHGHQQHLMNAALGVRGVQFYVNHPGERPFSGGNRPSYWAGNGTIPYIEQYHNLMVMIYMINPEELVHHIHAYTPFYEYDEYELTGKWLFIRVDEAYLGAYFSNGIQEVNEGANTGKEIISEGLNHAVIIKCSSQSEFQSFRSFCTALKMMNVEYDGNKEIGFIDPQYDAVKIKATDKVTIQGEHLAYEPKPALEIKRGMKGKL